MHADVDHCARGEADEGPVVEVFGVEHGVEAEQEKTLDTGNRTGPQDDGCEADGSGHVRSRFRTQGLIWRCSGHERYGEYYPDKVVIEWCL